MTRILLDAMCGGIRAQLRMCGHDTAFALDREVEDADALLAIAESEDRLLVTRNRRLANRTDDAVLLESRDPEDQLAALAAAGIELSIPAEPTRCGNCNGELDRVPETAETAEYAPDPAAEPVWQCRDCSQYFWKGSHWERVAASLPD